jgi:hypothetical protein
MMEQREILEGAADAQPGSRIRIEAGDVLAAVEQLAFGRLVAAGNAIDDRGLARAVRADERKLYDLVVTEQDLGQRAEAAEAQRNTAHFQRVSHSFPPDMARLGRALCLLRDPTSAVTGRPSD